jgi:hypothetical protein
VRNEDIVGAVVDVANNGGGLDAFIHEVKVEKRVRR